jgi:hypothetical protein
MDWRLLRLYLKTTRHHVTETTAVLKKAQFCPPCSCSGLLSEPTSKPRCHLHMLFPGLVQSREEALHGDCDAKAGSTSQFKLLCSSKLAMSTISRHARMMDMLDEIERRVTDQETKIEWGWDTPEHREILRKLRQGEKSTQTSVTSPSSLSPQMPQTAAMRSRSRRPVAQRH